MRTIINSTVFFYRCVAFNREVCGLSVASDFTDLSDDMTEEQISALSSVYSSVEDIDLFIAGMMEKHVPGGRLGPTFSCIIANQVNCEQVKVV